MKHNKLSISIAILIFQLLPSQTFAQKTKEFTMINEVWATPYKSQDETALCAIFSDISFLETELHRMGKGENELSTMYVAYYLYIEKALRRIRLRGKVAYDFNGYFNFDAFEMIRKYGIVTSSDYSGLLPSQTGHYHYKFLSEVNTHLDEVEKEGMEGRLNSKWKDGEFISPWLETMKNTLNQSMGEPPVNFEYDNEIMTPKEFSDGVLGIPYDDYVKFTSYSYIGFDQTGELLVEGNWLHKHDFYNIKIDEYMNLIDNALNNGFSLTGDFHITEESYLGDLGYVDFQFDSTTTIIGQDDRDNLYENWKTNDVHNVHIIGLAKDEDGKKYYKIKDSVPTKYFPNSPKYFSENYFRARVLSVMLHKDGIPSEIRNKLEIEKVVALANAIDN